MNAAETLENTARDRKTRVQRGSQELSDDSTALASRCQMSSPFATHEPAELGEDACAALGLPFLPRTTDPPGRRPPDAAPVRAAGQALEFFCEQVLQHQLVEAEIGHQLLQLSVLFLQLLQPPDLSDPHPGVLLLPPVEGLLADAHLPNHFRDWSTQLSLAQSIGDLLLGVPALLHSHTGSWRRRVSPPTTVAPRRSPRTLPVSDTPGNCASAPCCSPPAKPRSLLAPLSGPQTRSGLSHLVLDFTGASNEAQGDFSADLFLGLRS